MGQIANAKGEAVRILPFRGIGFPRVCDDDSRPTSENSKWLLVPIYIATRNICEYFFSV